MSPVASSPPPQDTYPWIDIWVTPDIFGYANISCIFNMANLIWMESAFLKTIHYCHACDTVSHHRRFGCVIQ
jgi:hypothetical protein